MNTPTQTRSRLLSSKLRFEVGFTEYRSVAANPPGNAARQNDASILMGAFENPNALINVYGSTYFDRGLRGHFGALTGFPGVAIWDGSAAIRTVSLMAGFFRSQD
jgi:hypothetical protein